MIHPVYFLFGLKYYEEDKSVPKWLETYVRRVLWKKNYGPRLNPTLDMLIESESLKHLVLYFRKREKKWFVGYWGSSEIKAKVKFDKLSKRFDVKRLSTKLPWPKEMVYGAILNWTADNVLAA